MEGKCFAIILLIGHLFSVRGFLINSLQDQQCGGLPMICPQWCMETDAKGCTVCSKACQSSSGVSSFSAQQNGALSIINPNSMLSFNSGSANQNGIPGSSGQNGLFATSGQNGLTGNIQTGQTGSGLANAFNPGNIGPQNPFLSGATLNHPGNPSGVSNPSNSATSLNTVLGSNPSNPGGPSINNLFGSQSQNLGTGTNQNSGVSMSMPSTSTASTPMTTKTTTTKTTTKAPTTTQTPAATCPPVRCVPPCDKGITLDAAGCPVCLCI